MLAAHHRWSAVAKKISGRTGQQCAQRWRHKVRAASGRQSRLGMKQALSTAPCTCR